MSHKWFQVTPNGGVSDRRLAKRLRFAALLPRHVFLLDVASCKIFIFMRPLVVMSDVLWKAIQGKCLVSGAISSYDSGRGSSFQMYKRLSFRLVAIPLMLAVVVLGTQTVAHFDDNSHDESHCTCQVCHIVHAAIPQPSAEAQIHVPLRIVRFAASKTSVSTVESASILSIPRAPPA